MTTTLTGPNLLRVIIDTVGYIGPLEITSSTTLTQLRQLIQHNFDIDIIPKHYQFLSTLPDTTSAISVNDSASVSLRIPIGTKLENTIKAIKFLPSITLLPLPESPLPISIYVTLWHPNYVFRLWALPSCTVQNLRSEASRYWYLNPNDTILTDQDRTLIYPENAFVHDIIQTYNNTKTLSMDTAKNNNNPYHTTQPFFILHMKIDTMEKLIDPRSFRSITSTSTTTPSVQPPPNTIVSSSLTSTVPSNGNGKGLSLPPSSSASSSASSSSSSTRISSRRPSRRISTNLQSIHEELSAVKNNNSDKYRRLTQSEHFLDPDLYADIYDTSFIDDGSSIDNKSVSGNNNVYGKNSREQQQNTYPPENSNEWNQNNFSPTSSSRRLTRSDSLLIEDAGLPAENNNNELKYTSSSLLSSSSLRTGLPLQNFVQTIEQQLFSTATNERNRNHGNLSGPDTSLTNRTNHNNNSAPSLILPGAAVKYLYPYQPSDEHYESFGPFSSGDRLPFASIEDEKLFAPFIPLEQRLWRIFTWYASAGDSHDCFHLRARQWRCLLDDCGILLNTGNKHHQNHLVSRDKLSTGTNKKVFGNEGYDPLSFSFSSTATIPIDIADVIFTSVLADGRRTVVGPPSNRSTASNKVPLATLAKQNANRSHRTTLLQNNSVGKNTSGIDYFQFLRALISIALRHQTITTGRNKAKDTDNESISSYTSLTSSVRDTSVNTIKIPDVSFIDNTIIDTHITAIETVAYLLSDPIDTVLQPNSNNQPSNRSLRSSDCLAFIGLLKNHIIPHSQHWLYDTWVNEYKQLELPLPLRTMTSTHELSPGKSSTNTEPELAGSILRRFAPALVQLFMYYAFTPLGQREKDIRSNTSPNTNTGTPNVSADNNTNKKSANNSNKELVHLMDLLRTQEAASRSSNSKEDTTDSSFLISSFHTFIDQHHPSSSSKDSSLYNLRSKQNNGKSTVGTATEARIITNPRLDLQVNGISPNSAVVELMLKSTSPTVVNQNLRKQSSQFVKEPPTVQLVRGYASKVTQATQGNVATATLPLSDKPNPSSKYSSKGDVNTSTVSGSSVVIALAKMKLSMEAFFRFITDIGLLSHGQLMLSMRTITEVYLASASTRGLVQAYTAAGYDETEQLVAMDSTMASSNVVSIAVLPSSSRVKLSFPQFLACLGHLAIRMGDQAIHTSLVNLINKAHQNNSPVLESAGAAYTDSSSSVETTISIPLRTKALLQIISQNLAKINLVNIFELRKNVCGSQPEALFNGVARYQQIYNQMNRYDEFTDYLLLVSTCAKNAARVQKEWYLILQHQKQQQRESLLPSSSGSPPSKTQFSPGTNESKNDDYALRLARYVDGKIPIQTSFDGGSGTNKTVSSHTTVVSQTPSINNVYVYRKKQHNNGTDSLHSVNRIIVPPQLPGKEESKAKETNNGQLSLEELESLWKDTVRLKEVQEKLLTQRRAEAKAVALTLHHDEWLLKLAKQKHQINDDETESVPLINDNSTNETTDLVTESIQKLRKEQEDLLIQDMREELRNTEVARRHAVWAQLQHARQLTAYAIKEATERQHNRISDTVDNDKSMPEIVSSGLPVPHSGEREVSVPRSRSPVRSIGSTTTNNNSDDNGLPPNLTPEQAIQLLYAYGAGYLPTITPQQETQLLLVARPLLDTSGQRSSNNGSTTDRTTALPNTIENSANNNDSFVTTTLGTRLSTSPYSFSNQPSPSHEYPLINGSPLTGILDIFANTGNFNSSLRNNGGSINSKHRSSTSDMMNLTSFLNDTGKLYDGRPNVVVSNNITGSNTDQREIDPYHKGTLAKPPTILGRAISMEQGYGTQMINPSVSVPPTEISSNTTMGSSGSSGDSIVNSAILQYRLSSGTGAVPLISTNNDNIIPTGNSSSFGPTSNLGTLVPLLPSSSVLPSGDQTSKGITKDYNSNFNTVSSRGQSRVHMSPERIDLARHVSSNHLLYISNVNGSTNNSSLASPSHTNRIATSINLLSPTLPTVTVNNQDNVLSGEDIHNSGESDDIGTDGSLDMDNRRNKTVTTKHSTSNSSAPPTDSNSSTTITKTKAITLVKDNTVTVQIPRTIPNDSTNGPISSESKNTVTTDSTEGNRSPTGKSPVITTTNELSHFTPTIDNNNNAVISTSNITATNHGSGKPILKMEAVDETNENKGRKENSNTISIPGGASTEKEKLDRSLSPQQGKTKKPTTEAVSVSPKDNAKSSVTTLNPPVIPPVQSSTGTLVKSHATESQRSEGVGGGIPSTIPVGTVNSQEIVSSTSTTAPTVSTNTSTSSSNNVPPTLSREEQRNRDIIEKRLIYKRLLLSGCIFIKYGRSGFPHKRIIWVDENLEMIRWRKTNTKLPPSLGLPSGSNNNGSSANDKDNKEVINVADIVEIVEGATTPVFLRNTRAITSSNCCFSIVGQSRTLDLEAESSAQRDEWVTALLALKKYRRMI